MMAGAEVFTQNCTTCHGGAAEGSAQGPALNSTGRTASMSDDELRQVILQGRGAMPGWSDKLAPEGVDAVIYFLRIVAERR
jgi:mono/diheme cytochrome c family protein